MTSVWKRRTASAPAARRRCYSGFAVIDRRVSFVKHADMHRALMVNQEYGPGINDKEGGGVIAQVGSLCGRPSRVTSASQRRLPVPHYHLSLKLESAPHASVRA